VSLRFSSLFHFLGPYNLLLTSTWFFLICFRPLMLFLLEQVVRAIEQLCAFPIPRPLHLTHSNRNAPTRAYIDEICPRRRSSSLAGKIIHPSYPCLHITHTSHHTHITSHHTHITSHTPVVIHIQCLSYYWWNTSIGKVYQSTKSTLIRNYVQCCAHTASITNGTVNYGTWMTSTSHNRN